MLALKLALRNLFGAGIRTWLNVFVLSLSFVIIIWHKGFLEGWHQQARRDMINWEIGGGQYWHRDYDPYDPFTFETSHAPLAPLLRAMADSGELTPVLLTQATIYPEGRSRNILLRGIDPEQRILELPSHLLESDGEEIPAILGTRMARNTGLEPGDYVTVRWRDAAGVFDAAEIKVTGLFKTNVPTVDLNQIWVPLERLRGMLALPGEATLIVARDESHVPVVIEPWSFQDRGILLAEIEQIIEQKSIGGSIIYFLLLSLALLAIFDTQVLSIFRRQKEIGTHIALGMTRPQVIGLFTLEGAMHAVLAAVLAAVYGVPLLALQASHGFKMPGNFDDYGLAIAERIFPAYSGALVLSTVLIVFASATLVSFLPTRRIAKMKPTDALRGKIQ